MYVKVHTYYNLRNIIRCQQILKNHIFKTVIIRSKRISPKIY